MFDRLMTHIYIIISGQKVAIFGDSGVSNTKHWLKTRFSVNKIIDLVITLDRKAYLIWMYIPALFQKLS